MHHEHPHAAALLLNALRCRDGDLNASQAHPRTLFLVVHDEAHWQATEANKNKYLNDSALVDSANVVVLCVSATPYNLCTRNSRIPKDHVVAWMRTDSDEASNYYGLREFIDATKQLSEDFMQMPMSDFIGLKPGTIYSGKGIDRHDLYETNVEYHVKRRRANPALKQRDGEMRCVLLC